MGTRSITKILTVVITVSSQCTVKSDRSVKVFNGAACLAASMVAVFKKEPGGIYLYPVNSADEEYNYDVHVAWVDRVQSDQDPIEIEVRAYGKSEFKGNRQAFLAWCTKPSEANGN